MGSSFEQPMSWSRRDVLRAMAVGGLAAAVPWGRLARAQAVARRSRPFLALPEGVDTLPQIEHIVVVMMENHSFDNYLGMLGRPDADGFTLAADGRPTAVNNAADGSPVRAFHMPTECQLDSKPSQSWNASHVQWDNGLNDGFVRSDSGPVAMGYWTGDDIPFYYSLARTFPLADRWFGSCLAQTYPNRRFLMAASAFGLVGDPLPGPTDPPPPTGTIFDRLNAHGISWCNYFVDLPEIGLFPSVLEGNLDKIRPIAAFYADAAAGTLPAFSLVTPQAVMSQLSEENPQDVQLGEAYASSLVDAVMHGLGWNKTLLVWCYDEHGGYYDHVPPPPAVPPDNIAPAIGPTDQPGGYDRYGFRVPAVVVSPFSKPNFVSHTVYDHTSILKTLEVKYNLEPLTNRDAAANPILDMLDFTTPPAFAEPPTLALPGAASIVGAECLVTGPGTIPPS